VEYLVEKRKVGTVRLLSAGDRGNTVITTTADAFQRANQVLDSAERVCLVGDRYKFNIDASGNLTIAKFLPGGADTVYVDRGQAKGGQFFDNEEVRHFVDANVRGCLKSMWPLVLRVMETKQSKPVIRIACTGEYEGNCPGAHDAFYQCGYTPPDDQIASQICKGAPSKAVRLKTLGGNRCGYSLIQVTCDH
jgi:hypothetical protein